ncbi:MAG TPA: hypothetical protein VLS93_11140 [Anaeromyxobacteraceae bacterium]|nr:hypothetical protein [Anaeromyxobacteraceae bacterium]
MGVLLAILSAVLHAVLGLVLLVVLLPIRARASGAVHDGTPSGQARADWGLGLLAADVDARRGVTLRVAWIPVARFGWGAARGRRKEARRRGRRREEERRRERAGALARLRAALAERAAFPDMAARLARAIHLRVRASGRVGTGDPADDAALAALLAALGALPGAELALEVDWVEEALELDLALSARVWIAELLAVVALVLLAGRNRRALRAAFGGSRT